MGGILKFVLSGNSSRSRCVKKEAVTHQLTGKNELYHSGCSGVRLPKFGESGSIKTTDTLIL